MCLFHYFFWGLFCLAASLLREALPIEEALVVVEVDLLDDVLLVLLEDGLELEEVVKHLHPLARLLCEVHLATQNCWLWVNVGVHLVQRVALNRVLAEMRRQLVVHVLKGHRRAKQAGLMADAASVGKRCHLVCC
jgi:hypothetical protein